MDMNGDNDNKRNQQSKLDIFTFTLTQRHENAKGTQREKQ